MLEIPDVNDEYLSLAHTDTHIERIKDTEIDWSNPMQPKPRDENSKFTFQHDTYDNK